MELFKTLFESMDEGAMIDITIARKGDRLTVGLVPKANVKEQALKNLPMLTITGTAEELDEGYTQALKKPLESTKEVIDNTKDFEKELEDADAKTALKKKEDESVEKIMVKVGESEKKDPQNFQAIKRILMPVLKKYPKNKRLSSKMDEMNTKEPTMFNIDNVEKVQPKESPKVEPEVKKDELKAEPESKVEPEIVTAVDKKDQITMSL